MWPHNIHASAASPLRAGLHGLRLDGAQMLIVVRPPNTDVQATNHCLFGCFRLHRNWPERRQRRGSLARALDACDDFGKFNDPLFYCCSGLRPFSCLAMLFGFCFARLKLVLGATHDKNQELMETRRNRFGIFRCLQLEGWKTLILTILCWYLSDAVCCHRISGRVPTSLTHFASS